MKSKTSGAKAKLPLSNSKQEEGNLESDRATVGAVCSKEKGGVSVIRDDSRFYSDICYPPETRICIVCNVSGGQVLICRGNGCPLAFHDSCMDDPSFDEKGNFYCPVCWYRLKLEQVEETRKRVLLAEKSLLEFLNCDACDNDGDVKRGEGREDERGFSCGESEIKNEGQVKQVVRDKLSEGIKEKLVEGDQSMMEVESVRRSDEVHYRHDEATLVTDGHEGSDNKGKMDVEENSSDIHRLERQGKESAEEDAGREEGEKRHQEEREDKESEMAQHDVNLSDQEESKQPKIVHDSESDISDSETETPSIRITCLRRKVLEPKEVQNVIFSKKPTPQPKVASDGKAKNGIGIRASKRRKIAEEECSRNRDEEKDTRKYPMLVQESPMKLLTIKPFDGGRRKVPWTPEEEEMLKEGVAKFLKAKNKNMPWRKILEYGRHIFDSTRTPTNLKDKWRNMVSCDSL